MDPGSSAGRSGVGGSDTGRGGPERGLCGEVGVVYAFAIGDGERSMPLKTACRLEAACASVALYGAKGAVKGPG
jgi:hypothetical protein